MEISSMAQAMQLHAQIIKSGHHHDNKTNTQVLSKLFTFSALSPVGDLSYAHLILNSLHTSNNSYYYNTMIRAYSDSSDPSRSITLFLAMHSPEGPATPRPDKFTYPFVLKACSRLRHAHFGKQVHGLVFKAGMESDRYVNNSLIHMYSGCGEADIAFTVFDRMPGRDVVSWTSIIDGFVDNDRPVEAIKLFDLMVENNVDLNEATVVSVLRACADAGALSVGRKVHSFVKQNKLSSKANISTALIDMYAKCGCIDSAKQAFDETVNKDVFTWTALIAGLGSHGLCKEAMEMFEKMRNVKINPDEMTMTAVLSAFRNAGRVSEGMAFLKSMKKNYKIRPTVQHYGCMVDMLARAGRLDEAEDFIRKMPIEADGVLWRTLIWACKVHGDFDRSQRLIKQLELLKMDSSDCGSFVLLGNVYASLGMWQEKAKTRELMSQKGLVKPPGSSRIEIDGVVCEFTAGYSGHNEAGKIYEKLDQIDETLRQERYDPKLSEVLLEIDDEEKASQLLHHSEKLAVSLGLIKTGPGTVIRIVKNLRSCEDCHSFMKLISKVYQREIIIRDRIRFHHFSNGHCSCRDNW